VLINQRDLPPEFYAPPTYGPIPPVIQGLVLDYSTTRQQAGPGYQHITSRTTTKKWSASVFFNY